MQNHLLFFVFFFVWSTWAARLEVKSPDDNSTTSTIYEVLSPAVQKGILDFEIKAEVIFLKGCNGIRDAKKKDPQLGLNSTKYIAFVRRDESDTDCIDEDMPFNCQKESWCLGGIAEETFFDPAGLTVWSTFRKNRPRSDYKVPVVQILTADMIFLGKIITDAISNNLTYAMIITDDPNPWGAMFNSFAFLFLFQIIPPIWSTGCFVIIIWIFAVNYYKAQRDSIASNSSQNQRRYRPKRTSKLSFKKVCLILLAITQLSRIVFAVDPFFSKGIYPMLPAYFLLSCAISFEISTNILVSFVLRELTQAVKQINVMKRIKFAYALIIIFLILDFLIAYTSGTSSRIGGLNNFVVKAIFYVGLNIILGGWYFYQGLKFLTLNKIHEKKLKKESRPRRVLVRISMLSSASMFFLGILCGLVTVRAVFGTVWGYFGLWFSIMVVIQIASLAQILLFGDIPIDSAYLSKQVKRFISTSRQSDFDETCSL